MNMKRLRPRKRGWWPWRLPISVTWGEVRDEILRSLVEIASIPTKNYKEVIEVRVPTRFYWNPDGTFDGIEFGPYETELMPWQEDMVKRCLEAIIPSMNEGDDEGDTVPD